MAPKWKYVGSTVLAFLKMLIDHFKEIFKPTSSDLQRNHATRQAQAPFPLATYLGCLDLDLGHLDAESGCSDENLGWLIPDLSNLDIALGCLILDMGYLDPDLGCTKLVRLEDSSCGFKLIGDNWVRKKISHRGRLFTAILISTDQPPHGNTCLTVVLVVFVC